jgi:hypothetical protein
MNLVPTLADRGCHVVSVTDPHGRIIDFLDRSRYFFFQVAPQLYSRAWVDPRSRPHYSENVVVPWIEPGPLIYIHTGLTNVGWDHQAMTFSLFPRTTGSNCYYAPYNTQNTMPYPVMCFQNVIQYLWRNQDKKRILKIKWEDTDTIHSYCGCAAL